MAQEHAQHSGTVTSLAAPGDDASQGDGRAKFLLLCEQPWPVQTGVLAGEATD
jgi:hypothetical protein